MSVGRYARLSHRESRVGSSVISWRQSHVTLRHITPPLWPPPPMSTTRRSEKTWRSSGSSTRPSRHPDTSRSRTAEWGCSVRCTGATRLAKRFFFLAHSSRSGQSICVRVVLSPWRQQLYSCWLMCEPLVWRTLLNNIYNACWMPAICRFAAFLRNL